MMFIFLIKRIFYSIPVLFIIIIISFMLIHLIPGSPAAVILGAEATKEQILALEHQLGLDESITIQFFSYIKKIFTGDLGNSIFLLQPVMTCILNRINVTISLAIPAMIFAILFGISFGVLAAINQNKIIDHIIMTLAITGVSIPSFWLALNLMWMFGVKLKFLPVLGFVPITQDFLQHIKHIILPVICIGFPQVGFIARMTRSSMLEVIRQNYMVTAKAKGLTMKTVIIKHGLKNAMLPIITIIGMIFAILLGGTVIIETVFNIQGLGSLFIVAIQRRDYPVVQGGVLFIGIIFVLMNLLVDILYAYFDPRIDYR